MCCETSWDIKIKKWWCVTIFNHFKGSRTWQEALSTQWIGAAERLKWFFLCDDRSNRISFFGLWLFKSHFFFCGGCSHHLFCDDCSNRVFVWRLSSTLLQFFAMIVHKFFLRSLSRSHFLAMLVHFLFLRRTSKPSFRALFLAKFGDINLPTHFCKSQFAFSNFRF